MSLKLARKLLETVKEYETEIEESKDFSFEEYDSIQAVKREYLLQLHPPKKDLRGAEKDKEGGIQDRAKELFGGSDLEGLGVNKHE